MEKKTYILQHPDHSKLAWGLTDVPDLELEWVPISEAQTITSKWAPTYLNFAGSNSHAKEMKKGVVVAI